MIQMQSILAVADNSGAKKICCISIHGGSKGRYAGVGDVITASVKEAVNPEGIMETSLVSRLSMIFFRTRISLPAAVRRVTVFLSSATMDPE